MRAPDRFTGERLRRTQPRVYDSIVRALDSGLGIRLTARVFKTSPHTVLAIGERNGLGLAKLR